MDGAIRAEPANQLNGQISEETKKKLAGAKAALQSDFRSSGAGHDFGSALPEPDDF